MVVCYIVLLQVLLTMSYATIPFLTHNKAIGKGWYMFIVDANLHNVGLPDFENFVFCTDTKSDMTEGKHKMAKAYDKLQEYFVTEKLQARVHFAYALRHDKEKVYACVIGPLQLMMEGEIEKMEHFVDNTIPGITSNMVGFQLNYPALKYSFDEDLKSIRKFVKNKETIPDDASSMVNDIVLRTGHLM